MTRHKKSKTLQNITPNTKYNNTHEKKHVNEKRNITLKLSVAKPLLGVKSVVGLSSIFINSRVHNCNFPWLNIYCKREHILKIEHGMCQQVV
jgi:hypothetical protein